MDGIIALSRAHNSIEGRCIVHDGMREGNLYVVSAVRDRILR